MTHIALDPTFADLPDQTIASMAAWLLSANVTDLATTRLKASGVTYWPGQSTSATLATAGVADIPGTVGVTSYNSSGTAQTSADPTSVGMWLSTPVQRPLTVAVPWPISANARRVRIVVACSVTSPTGGVMDALAWVYDGGGWYPTPPTSAALEPEPATTYPSNDPQRFSALLQSNTAYCEIGVSTALDGVTFAEFIVDLGDRQPRDGSIQRPGDERRNPMVGVAFLSRIGTGSGSTLNDVTASTPANLAEISKDLHSFPGFPVAGVGAYHGTLALVDSSTNEYRYYGIQALGQNPNDPDDATSAPDIQANSNGWVYVWPPVRDTTFVNANKYGGHKLIGNTVIRILSLTVQELPDA